MAKNLEQEIQQRRFDSEHQKAIVNLLFTSNWIQAHIASILKPYGISQEQYNVLRILRGQHPKPATVRMIIERMLDKMSNASRLVEKLRTKDLVERAECSQDRRRVDVKITRSGLDLLDVLDTDFSALEDRMTGLSGAEAKQLNELLDQLRT